MSKKFGVSIGIFSLKGGVGKTLFTINLAGIYSLIKKKVLIMDLDLTGGSIALSTNKEFDKTIYSFADDYNNNRYYSLSEYVTHYNEYIDILPSPKDPRQASKIDSKYLEIAIEKAKYEYDVILIDTHHNLDETNLVLLDTVDEILFVMNNDPMDVKNIKNLLVIFKDLNKTNYKILLYNARDPLKNYFTLFDIKSILKANIDYNISSGFYIKNMDSYVMNGEIVTLNPKASTIFNKDFTAFMKIAADLLGREDDHE